MIVCKFGGTSVQDADAIARLARIVAERLDDRPLVVVSALAKVTDGLLQLGRLAEAGAAAEVEGTIDAMVARHREVAAALPGAGDADAALDDGAQALRNLLRPALGRPLTDAERDRLVGQGELWSSHVVAAALRGAGLDAAWVDAREVVVTDGRFGRATPLPDAIARAAAERVGPLLAAGRVPVTQGFIGATADGTPTTLGRGGSDFTASLLGAALRASRVEIWTDVNGMMTADPRLVPSARTLESATYDEAAELATFGAKVLHPATQLPLASAGIPIVILNSREPAHPGTVIQAEPVARTGGVGSISFKKGIILITVRAPRMLGAFGFLRALFEVFERHEVVVDVLASSEVSVSLTIEDRQRLDQVVRDLAPLGEVTIRDGMAIIAVVGEGLRATPGLAARVFAAADPANIEVISQGGSAINLTFVVREADGPGVVRRLHRTFFGTE